MDKTYQFPLIEGHLVVCILNHFVHDLLHRHNSSILLFGRIQKCLSRDLWMTARLTQQLETHRHLTINLVEH